MTASSNKTDPQQPEQQQIDDWLKSCQWRIDTLWEGYHEGDSKKENEPESLTYINFARYYAELARVQCLNGEPCKVFRESFSKAAGHILKCFKTAYDKTDPEYVGDKEPDPTGWRSTAYGCVCWQHVADRVFIEGIHYALMGANFEITRELAKWFRKLGENGDCGKIVYSYAHALKFAVMGLKNDGKELAQQSLNEQEVAHSVTIPFDEPSRSRALYAILDNDVALFHSDDERWRLLCDYDARYLMKLSPNFTGKKEELTTVSSFFAKDHAVALANLAIYYDMKVKIDHFNLPKDLILQPEGVVQ